MDRSPGTFTVRMLETRVIVHGLHEMTQLLRGKEYALPKEFAADLICNGKAEFRNGRLRKFAPREALCPVRKEHVDWKKVILLDD